MLYFFSIFFPRGHDRNRLIDMTECCVSLKSWAWNPSANLNIAEAIKENDCSLKVWLFLKGIWAGTLHGMKANSTSSCGRIAWRWFSFRFFRSSLTFLEKSPDINRLASWKGWSLNFAAALRKVYCLSVNLNRATCIGLANVAPPWWFLNCSMMRSHKFHIFVQTHKVGQDNFNKGSTRRELLLSVLRDVQYHNIILLEWFSRSSILLTNSSTRLWSALPAKLVLMTCTSEFANSTNIISSIMSLHIRNVNSKIENKQKWLDYTKIRPWISLLKSINALIQTESGIEFHNLDEK